MAETQRKNRSIKERIKYWYYFLKLVEEFDYKELNKNLRKSDVKKFYKQFGKYRTENYETWWRNNSKKFKDDSATVEILTAGYKVDDDQDALYIKMPYRYTPNRANAIFRDIFARNFIKRYV